LNPAGWRRLLGRGIPFAASSLFVALSAACPSPRQYEGPIPIDRSGFAERFGRACALGGAQGATCAPRENDEIDGGFAEDAASRGAPVFDAEYRGSRDEDAGYRGSRDAEGDEASIDP
jgi:hypothetical protein